MRTVGRVALMTLLASGGLLLALGVTIWTGIGGEAVIPVHIVVGVILIGSLWTLAAVALRSGVSTGPVAFAAAWGLIVLAFGLSQEELVPGEWHWTIQVAHVAISMGAVWWGRRLVGLMRQRAASVLSAPRPARVGAVYEIAKKG